MSEILRKSDAFHPGFGHGLEKNHALGTYCRHALAKTVEERGHVQENALPSESDHVQGTGHGMEKECCVGGQTGKVPANHVGMEVVFGEDSHTCYPWCMRQ